MVDSPGKRCPACAEVIRAEALVCRYCGYSYTLGIPGTSQKNVNGFAIASLVLGIVWIWGIGSVLAIVFSQRARREIKDSGGRQTGDGFAVAGLVLGWVGLGILALIFVGLVIDSL